MRMMAMTVRRMMIARGKKEGGEMDHPLMRAISGFFAASALK
jgi:hypothetical protein